MNRRLLATTALLPLACLTTAAVSGCSSQSTSVTSQSSADGPSRWTTTPPKPLPHGVSLPASISIPKININQKIVGLGLKANGNIEPPPHVIQWYNATVIPGQNGNSVIAGHVSWDGPDVFAHLDQLKVGDKLTVTYADKHRTVFQVTKTAAVGKDALRQDQSVWGSSKKPNLILITCDDHSKMIGQHYVDNYVVWTKPVALVAP